MKRIENPSTTTDLSTSTALVTRTNRGLGRSLALALVRRGANVYAIARRPELVDIPGATILRVDNGLEAGDLEIVGTLGAEAKASLAGPPRAFDLASIARP